VTVNNHALYLILDNIRSAHNVGAILRTCDAAGVAGVYACGYTPYPLLQSDDRPSHIAASNARAIAKTALGAEKTVPVLHFPETQSAISEAKQLGFKIMVLEQSERSLNLYRYTPTGPLALVVGNEVDGVSPEALAAADSILELPMLGRKESLNVAVSTGIALYHLRFGNKP
jgi:23S rRNA (guanosine2251-2'-O)-methyltransferase